jgi:4-alpha-glucanotransferase
MTRSAGVLLHPSSLPGRGIGDLGEHAHRFVDWLAGAEQSLWQVLPLVPVDEGGSPYNGLSAVGGNPFLIAPDLLVSDGLLPAEAVTTWPVDADPVDYPAVWRWKKELLAGAHRAFRSGAAPGLGSEFAAYREANAAWLEDLALFLALREHNGGAPWTAWAPELRERVPEALDGWGRELAGEVERHAFVQFLFHRQWQALRAHARSRGIRIIGDVPIFVAHDSADVWAHRELFKLDERGEPTVVAGVPPDYFSETGQRWGNPLYDWDAMQREGYRWWIQRFRLTLEQVDVVRVDHFRGFEAFWEVPATEPTAVRGIWRQGPGRALFDAVSAALGELPLIAEDLGLITPAVEALRDELALPGMRVLEFAFDGNPENPHLPANYPRRAVAYPGTHDNATAAGWWEAAPPAERRLAGEVLDVESEPVNRAAIAAVWRSEADWAIAALQDVLGLGSEARMNTPGTITGNWRWRVAPSQFTRDDQRWLGALTRATGRAYSHPHRSAL